MSGTGQTGTYSVSPIQITTSGTIGITTIKTLDSSNNVGAFSNLLQVNGNPGIAYYDSTNRCVKYNRFGHGDINVSYLAIQQ